MVEFHTHLQLSSRKSSIKDFPSSGRLLQAPSVPRKLSPFNLVKSQLGAVNELRSIRSILSGLKRGSRFWAGAANVVDAVIARAARMTVSLAIVEELGERNVEWLKNVGRNNSFIYWAVGHSGHPRSLLTTSLVS